ncbi:hypothetical protein [Streptomyces sp. NPDC002044]
MDGTTATVTGSGEVTARHDGAAGTGIIGDVAPLLRPAGGRLITHCP